MKATFPVYWVQGRKPRSPAKAGEIAFKVRGKVRKRKAAKGRHPPELKSHRTETRCE